MTTILQTDPASVFEKFHDPLWVKPQLQARLRDLVGFEGVIQHCEISYVHYKRYLKVQSRHKSFLSLCYDLSIADHHGGIRSQKLFAKAYLNNRGQLEFHRIVQKGNPHLPQEQRPLYLADLDMIVWRFPADPLLPQLPKLLDPQQVLQYVPQNYRSEGPRFLMRITPQVIHYRPENRCTIRYDLLEPQRSSRRVQTFFAKTFQNQEKMIFERMEMLWNIFQHVPCAIQAPKPIAYDENLNTIWQDGVSGLPLGQIINASNYQSFMALTARGIATLQQSPLPTSYGVSSHDHIIEFKKKSQKLSQVYPPGEQVLKSIEKCLEGLAPLDSTRPTCIIHGDFHIGQLLADHTSVTFFDLDECMHGDPLQDVANFLVDLQFLNFPPDLRQQMSQSFVKAYMSLVPWEVSPQALDWHQAIQFTNKVYRSFVQRKPSFEDDFDRFIRFVETSSLSITQHESC